MPAPHTLISWKTSHVKTSYQPLVRETLTPFLMCQTVTLYGMLISVLSHRLCMSLSHQSVFYMYLFIVDSISYFSVIHCICPLGHCYEYYYAGACAVALVD